MRAFGRRQGCGEMSSSVGVMGSREGTSTLAYRVLGCMTGESCKPNGTPSELNSWFGFSYLADLLEALVVGEN